MKDLVAVKEVEAKVITVNLGDYLQKYEDKFLIIFNNARECSSTFYKIKNFYGNNNVELIINRNDEKAVLDWVAQFGEILDVEDTKILAVECDHWYPAILDIDLVEE